MARPPIPADLQRRVLVEAGHRCAIPTCRNPDIDLHHILPWEKCKSHDFDNLIALCPNCHRRAHNGEIDRKSLLLYKAQLAAAFGLPTAMANSTLAIGSSIEVRWSTNRISEKETKPHHRYTVEIEFPQFHPDGGELAEVNVLQKAHALGLLHEARCLRLIHGQSFDERLARGKGKVPKQVEDALRCVDDLLANCENETVASYEVLLFDGDFLSIKHTQYEYEVGAAHGRSQAVSFNYHLAPLVPLRSEDMFGDLNAAVKALSRYCIKEIERDKQAKAPDKWVRDGASPKWENFDCINLVGTGLIVTFGEYQVGPYSDGIRSVFVPAQVVQKLINPKLGLGEIWNQVR